MKQQYYAAKTAKKELKNELKSNPVRHREDRSSLVKQFINSDVPNWGSLVFKVL